MQTQSQSTMIGRRSESRGSACDCCHRTSRSGRTPRVRALKRAERRGWRLQIRKDLDA